MRRIGEVPWGVWSYSTCVHRGRTLAFLRRLGKLVVVELILGEGIECLEAETGVACKPESDWEIGCCSLGDRVLVMAGQRAGISAALVDVGEGRLSAGAVRATGLAVSGDRYWEPCPFLCRASGSRALLYFGDHRGLWYCDVAGGSLAMRRLAAEMPARGGFSAPPIRLPGGKMLVAGSKPSSRAITLISCGDEPRFEEIGELPGAARFWASSVLLTERFVAGFGGFSGRWLDDLWVFDLQSRTGSQVRREGEWHAEDSRAALVARDGALYLIAGENTTSAYSISFAALAGLVRGNWLRFSLSWSLGLPLRPSGRFARGAARECVSPRL